MKVSLNILIISIILGSCASNDANDLRESKIQPQEEVAEDKEPVVSYPIKITQRNLRERYLGSEGTYFKYDSIEITQFTDSSYFYQYFREGRPTPKIIDTLILPDPIPVVQDTSSTNKQQLIPNSLFSGPGRGEILYTVEIEGKSYKIVEKSSSCCSFWKPMGHVHQGSKSYFSLDFGMLGSFIMNETHTSKTLWLADWDQELVDKIIESLPLNYNHPNDKLLLDNH